MYLIILYIHFSQSWAKRRPFDLKFNFPNNGPEVVAKVEDLFVDLRPSQTGIPLYYIINFKYLIKQIFF